MATREFGLGWYHIDAVWNLYVDGELQEVHVDFLEVDDTPDDEDDRFHVSHYDRAGSLLNADRLYADDLNPELRDRETTDRPMHI